MADFDKKAPEYDAWYKTQKGALVDARDLNLFLVSHWSSLNQLALPFAHGEISERACCPLRPPQRNQHCFLIPTRGMQIAIELRKKGFGERCAYQTPLSLSSLMQLETSSCP